MEKYSKFIFLIGWIIFLASCEPTKPTVVKDYSLDLTPYRVSYTDTILENKVPERPNKWDLFTKKLASMTVQNSNAQLSQHLRGIAKSNEKIKYSYGYVVQVYSGGNREEANNHIRQARTMTNETVKIVYKEPNYQVHIGNYLSRPMAHQTYTLVKKAFPTSLIIPCRIKIEHYKYASRTDDEEDDN